MHSIPLVDRIHVSYFTSDEPVVVVALFMVSVLMIELMQASGFWILVGFGWIKLLDLWILLDQQELAARNHNLKVIS